MNKLTVVSFNAMLFCLVLQPVLAQNQQQVIVNLQKEDKILHLAQNKNSEEINLTRIEEINIENNQLIIKGDNKIQAKLLEEIKPEVQSDGNKAHWENRYYHQLILSNVNLDDFQTKTLWKGELIWTPGYIEEQTPKTPLSEYKEYYTINQGESIVLFLHPAIVKNSSIYAIRIWKANFNTVVILPLVPSWDDNGNEIPKQKILFNQPDEKTVSLKAIPRTSEAQIASPKCPLKTSNKDDEEGIYSVFPYPQKFAEIRTKSDSLALRDTPNGRLIGTIPNEWQVVVKKYDETGKWAYVQDVRSPYSPEQIPPELQNYAFHDWTWNIDNIYGSAPNFNSDGWVSVDYLVPLGEYCTKPKYLALLSSDLPLKLNEENLADTIWHSLETEMLSKLNVTKLNKTSNN